MGHGSWHMQVCAERHVLYVPQALEAQFMYKNSKQHPGMWDWGGGKDTMRTRRGNRIPDSQHLSQNRSTVKRACIACKSKKNKQCAHSYVRRWLNKSQTIRGKYTKHHEIESVPRGNNYGGAQESEQRRGWWLPAHQSSSIVPINQINQSVIILRIQSPPCLWYSRWWSHASGNDDVDDWQLDKSNANIDTGRNMHRVLKTTR